MRKFIPLITLAVAVLVSCSATPTSKQANLNQFKVTALVAKEELPVDFIPQEIKIVSVGDSLTEGVGDSKKRGGYVPYLKEMLELDRGVKAAEIDNFGVKGNRSDQLLEKLGTNKVKQAIKEANIIIVTIGGNDVMKVVRENFTSLTIGAFEKERKIYEQNLRDVINNVRKENEDSAIVLIGIYNPFDTWFANINEINEIIDNWNEGSKKILAQYPDTYFVNVEDIFLKGGEDLLYTDYFHPNDQGYELIAGRVHEALSTDVLNDTYSKAFVAEKEENTD